MDLTAGYIFSLRLKEDLPATYESAAIGLNAGPVVGYTVDDCCGDALLMNMEYLIVWILG